MAVAVRRPNGEIVVKRERLNFFSEKKFNLSRFTTISPFGLRTATAIELGDRIMTPSITACPPTRI
jgi:hypothetical protein